MPEFTTYSVIWKYNGKDHIIDVDDEAYANKLAQHIAESPYRTNVRIIVSSLEIDDGILKKISERVASRLKEIIDRENLLDPKERMHANH